jgi:hypothetical protein
MLAKCHQFQCMATVGPPAGDWGGLETAIGTGVTAANLGGGLRFDSLDQAHQAHTN